MGILGKLFSSITSEFKKLEPENKRRITLLVSLSGFVPQAVEKDLIAIVESAGTAGDAGHGTILPEIKKKVVTELTLAIISSCRIPDDGPIQYWWDFEGEFLREVVCVLVLAESNDERQVLQDVDYSANPDEARAQALLNISRLLGREGGSLIQRLNCGEFLESWHRCTTMFVQGALTGIGRLSESAVIARTPKHLRALSPRGESIIRELIGRANRGQFSKHRQEAS